MSCMLAVMTRPPQVSANADVFVMTALQTPIVSEGETRSRELATATLLRSMIKGDGGCGNSETVVQLHAAVDSADAPDDLAFSSPDTAKDGWSVPQTIQAKLD